MHCFCKQPADGVIWIGIKTGRLGQGNCISRWIRLNNLGDTTSRCITVKQGARLELVNIHLRNGFASRGGEYMRGCFAFT